MSKFWFIFKLRIISNNIYIKTYISYLISKFNVFILTKQKFYIDKKLNIIKEKLNLIEINNILKIKLDF